MSEEDYEDIEEQEETDLRDMFNRVSDTITDWGKDQKYFDSVEEMNNFCYKFFVFFLPPLLELSYWSFSRTCVSLDVHAWSLFCSSSVALVLSTLSSSLDTC
jgi:hypothetical protein